MYEEEREENVVFSAAKQTTAYLLNKIQIAEVYNRIGNFYF